MPVPRSDDARRLLRSIWDLFDLTEGWPTVGQVANHLDRHHDLVLESALVQTDAQLLYGVDPARQPSDQEQIGLTIAGASAVENSAEAIGLVVCAIRLAARVQQTWVPPVSDRHAKAQITADDLVREVLVPAAGRSMLLAQVGALLRAESWGWTAAGHATRDAWSFTVDRHVRVYRDVVDVDDLWSRMHPATTSGAGTSGAGTSAPAATSAPAFDRPDLGG